MNMTLTITGNAAQLISVLSALNGTTALTPVPAPVNEDDDGLHPAFNLVPEVQQPAPVSAPAALAEQILQNHAAQVAPVAAPVADNAVDSEGLPWDKRIHASSKAFNADGSWRKKRNLDDTILNAVLAELRANAGNAVQPAPAAPGVPPMPTVNSDGEQVQVQIAQPVVPVAPAPVPEPVVAQIPAPVPAAPVVAAAPVTVPATLDMPTFMMHIGPKMGQVGADGQPLLSPDYLAGITAEISTAFGSPLTVITDIAANPAMIKYAADCLARDGKW